MLYSYFLRLAKYNHYSNRTLNLHVLGQNHVTRLNVFIKGMNPEIFEEVLGQDWFVKYLKLSMIGPSMLFMNHYGKLCVLKHIYYPDEIWDESVFVSYVIKYNKDLKLCKKCFDEHKNKYGEWSLMTKHNCFSPKICCNHKVPLSSRKINVIDFDKIMDASTYTSIGEFNYEEELKYSKFINSYLSNLSYEDNKIVLKSNKFTKDYTSEEISEFLNRMQSNVLGKNKEPINRIINIFTEDLSEPFVIADLNNLVEEMQSLRVVYLDILEYTKNFLNGKENTQLKNQIISSLDVYSNDIEEIQDLIVQENHPPAVLIYNKKVGNYTLFAISVFLQHRMMRNCLDIIDIDEVIDNEYIGFNPLESICTFHCNRCDKNLEMSSKHKIKAPEYCDKCKKISKKYNFNKIYEDKM